MGFLCELPAGVENCVSFLWLLSQLCREPSLLQLLTSASLYFHVFRRVQTSKFSAALTVRRPLSHLENDKEPQMTGAGIPNFSARQAAFWC